MGKRPAGKISEVTSVQGCLSSAQFKKVKTMEEALFDKTSALLLAELRKNEQSRSGKKAYSKRFSGVVFNLICCKIIYLISNRLCGLCLLTYIFYMDYCGLLDPLCRCPLL